VGEKYHMAKKTSRGKGKNMQNSFMTFPTVDALRWTPIFGPGKIFNN
jgi:hypothetical protein